MIYLESEKDKTEYSSLIRVEKNGRFKFPFTLPKISGKYYFILASGNSFQTTEPESINLVERESITYPEIQGESLAFKPTLITGTYPYISLPPQSWATLSIQQ